jgi:ABC-2 type transport system permease protein
VRWLLLKDLQILRRSPLLVALLVLYPIVVALLSARALVRAGEAEGRVRQPRAARRGADQLGGQQLDATQYAAELFEASTRSASTRARRRSRRCVGRGARRARDPGRRDRAAAGHARPRGGEPPTVEVYYNAENR